MSERRKRGRPRNTVASSAKERPIRSEHILIKSCNGKGITAEIFKVQAV